jgi:hypothetical protein
MVRIDGNKLQEIRDHHRLQAESEIARAKADVDTEELTDSDVLAIEQKWEFQSNQVINSVTKSNPEKIYKNGFALDGNGWREGYTVSFIKDRVAKRRMKKKLGKKTRQQQRRSK